jgi:hypothetical protein|tara:strand:+ start:397 stop:564 length:168 start_codon:yes stop_codon:yes gene_type:complete
MNSSHAGIIAPSMKKLDSAINNTMVANVMITVAIIVFVFAFIVCDIVLLVVEREQ